MVLQLLRECLAAAEPDTATPLMVEKRFRAGLDSIFRSGKVAVVDGVSVRLLLDRPHNTNVYLIDVKPGRVYQIAPSYYGIGTDTCALMRKDPVTWVVVETYDNRNRTPADIVKRAVVDAVADSKTVTAAAEPDSGQISDAALNKLRAFLPDHPKEIVPGFTMTRYVVQDPAARRVLYRAGTSATPPSETVNGSFALTRSGKSHVGRSRLLPLTLCLRGEWNVYKTKLSVYPVSGDVSHELVPDADAVGNPKGSGTNAYAGIENALSSTTTAKDVLKLIHTNAVTLHDKWMRLGFR